MAALDVQSSNSPPDLQKFNFQDLLKKKRLHLPTTQPRNTPRPHGLPPATRAAFGFALAIARTKAKDWLALASASRIDPTPTVTVGRLQPD